MFLKIKRLARSLRKRQRRLALVSFVFSAGLIPVAVLLFWFRKTEPLVYVLNEAERAAWHSIVTAHPLTSNLEPELITEYTNPALMSQPADRPALYMYASDWLNPKTDNFLPQLLTGLITRKKLLSSTYLAPAVPFWSERNNISLNELELTPVPVLPLEDIKLPYKAIPVEGKYPSDPDYPLKKEVWLYYKEGHAFIPGHSSQDMTHWFDSLPEEKPDLPDIVWIGACGDLMLERGISSLLITAGGKAVFNDLLPLLQSQDLLLGNLEGAVTKEKTPAKKAFTFHFPPAVLPCLKEAGFDYLALANNHTFDFGLKGFTDTLSYLKNADIAYSGAGNNLQEALRPWKTCIRGQEVAVLALSAYPKELNTGFDGEKETQATAERAGVLWATEATITAIAASFSPSVFDIVMIHGGEEWMERPTRKQQALYEKLIKKGADLVLGSHPHVLEGMKAIDGKLICFSLGNFLFNGMGGMPYAEDTLLFSAGVMDNGIKYICYYPARINGTTVALDKGGNIATRFIRLTRELN